MHAAHVARARGFDMVVWWVVWWVVRVLNLVYMYGGLYGQNLPYKFKNSYGDFQNHNFDPDTSEYSCTTVLE
jgi:hypothetical protein